MRKVLPKREYQQREIFSKEPYKNSRGRIKLTEERISKFEGRVIEINHPV